MNIHKDLVPYAGKYFQGKWPSITQLFNISLSLFPQRECFVAYEPKKIAYTYSEVREYTQNIASVLIESGIKKGDKVAINGKNSIQWAIAYLAVNYAGAVGVPVDNQLPVSRFQSLAQFADCKYVLADEDILSKLDTTCPWCEQLLGMMSLKERDNSYTNIMNAKASKVYDEVTVSEDDLASILFTSGTTGNEKGVMLTNKNFVSNIFYSADTFDNVSEKDIFYALLPLHHSYCFTAVLLETIKFGASCVFGRGIIVSRMIADMKLGKVTIFMGIPLLYNKLLAGINTKLKEKGMFTFVLIKSLMFINGLCKQWFNKSPFKGFFEKKIFNNLGFDHINFLICGAGPLAPSVYKQYRQLGLDFLQGYGLTETAPILALNPINAFDLNATAKVINGVELIIADPDENGVGEIRVKGENITSGYYKDEVNTALLFDENGYLKTGDLATMNSRQYITIKGRCKNLIVTEGGKNVFPEEIEDAFQTYSEVEQILIRGFQAKKNLPSECIEAVIFPNAENYKNQSKEQIDESIKAIVKEVNKNLSSYKKIEKITILDEPLAMTTTKKIKRNIN